ncbi:MAG: hypothetical protein IKY52_05690 [Clostridia bacterium]|nr:hypothetical protein [Clostridia bacterium]
MLGAIVFSSKIAMEALPNIHPAAMLLMAYTVVYRSRALIPLYVYVFMVGLFYGFNLWWYPYLYIWTILWAVTMLLPKNMNPRVAAVVYPVVCALFGFAYGTLYAPAQALMFGYNFSTTIKWILAGLPYDFLHGLGNLGMGLLVLPLSLLLKKLNRMIRID